MSKPIYILRFDDVCPTMNWKIWGKVEEIMYKYDIKPIIGVIPDNLDPELDITPPHPQYWNKLLEWQSRGWVIALHGYHHKYENTNGGLLNVNSYSEFAGVPFEIQLERLQKGIKIIRSHGLECKTWIAPAHSFDINTVKCLPLINIDVISDGYSSDVFKRAGLKWVPCQLYRFSPREKGVWTVCKHPNMWDEEDLMLFEKEIDKWHTSISSLSNALARFESCSSFMMALNSIQSSFICQKNYIIRILKKFVKYSKSTFLTLIKKGIIKIKKGNYIKKSIKVGVNIGDNCRLNDYPRWGSEPWLISLGNHVEISLNVTFLTHDGATWCFREHNRYKDVIRYGKIIVEDNCFIGANSTLLPGVRIGKNTIVGAGSVVTKNLEPNSVYAGVPAKRICSLEDYAEKCLRETPTYNKAKYEDNKKDEVLRILN